MWWQSKRDWLFIPLVLIAYLCRTKSYSTIIVQYCQIHIATLRKFGFREIDQNALLFAMYSVKHAQGKWPTFLVARMQRYRQSWHVMQALLPKIQNCTIKGICFIINVQFQVSLGWSKTVHMREDFMRAEFTYVCAGTLFATYTYKTNGNWVRVSAFKYSDSFFYFCRPMTYRSRYIYVSGWTTAWEITPVSKTCTIKPARGREEQVIKH